MKLPTLTEYIASSILETNNVDTWERLDLSELIMIALENGSEGEFEMTDQEYTSLSYAINQWAQQMDGLQEKIDELRKEGEDNFREWQEAMNDAINN